VWRGIVGDGDAPQSVLGQSRRRRAFAPREVRRPKRRVMISFYGVVERNAANRKQAENACRVSLECGAREKGSRYI
jgi:hypothetical protein